MSPLLLLLPRRGEVVAGIIRGEVDALAPLEADLSGVLLLARSDWLSSSGGSTPLDRRLMLALDRNRSIYVMFYEKPRPYLGAA